VALENLEKGIVGKFYLAAKIAASLQVFASYAPLNPGVSLAIFLANSS